MNCLQCGERLPSNAKFCPACGMPVLRRDDNIPPDISQRVQGFTGRVWALDEVLSWLDHEAERFMLITGEPGSGKTALLAWLIGAGHFPADNTARRKLEQVRRRLMQNGRSMTHFCMADDKHGSINPGNFSRSLAGHLSQYYDTYAEAVLEQIAPQFDIHQQVRENWGQVIGIQIDKFIADNNAGETYNRTVREPLKELFRHQPDERLFILVDALDEALTFGNPNIVTLLRGSDDLPTGVRFLLTSRNEPKVTDQFKKERTRPLNLSGQEHVKDWNIDIQAYVEQRLAEPTVRQNITAFGSQEPIRDRLVMQAEGNFLYIKFLLDAVARGERSLANLNGLPRGLYGLYRDYLDRLLPGMLAYGSSPLERWQERVRPLMGALSVAIPSAPQALLPAWLGREESEVSDLVSEFRQIIEYEPGNGGGYRLYHLSMRDFLATPYEEDSPGTPNRYYTPLYEQHARIAHYYLETYGRDWLRCNDDYGLMNTPVHLAEAVYQLTQPGQATTRTKLTSALAALLNDKRFLITRYLRVERTVYSYLDQLTSGYMPFIAGESIFRSLNTWLEGSGPRLFLITGVPGSGKTTLAERLVQMSRGKVPTVDYPHLGPSNLMIVHFSAMYANRRLGAQHFLEAIAQQLGRRYHRYAGLLSEMVEIGREISVEEIAQVTNPAAIGESVRNVVGEFIGLLPAKEALGRVVLAPLGQVCTADFKSTILILVDALDEVLDQSMRNEFLRLLRDLISETDHLDGRVRFLLTARPASELFDTIGGWFSSRIADETVDGEITAQKFVHRRLGAMSETEGRQFLAQLGRTNFHT